MGDASQSESTTVYFVDECAVAARPPHAGTDPLSAQASRQLRVVAFLQGGVSAFVRSRVERTIFVNKKCFDSRKKKKKSDVTSSKRAEGGVGRIGGAERLDGQAKKRLESCVGSAGR